MSKRTKAQKQRIASKRVSEVMSGSAPSFSYTAPQAQTVSRSRASFTQEFFGYPVTFIYQDLLKTIVITFIIMIILGIITFRFA